MALKQQRALLLALIVGYVVGIFLSRIAVIMIPAMIENIIPILQLKLL